MFHRPGQVVLAGVMGLSSVAQCRFNSHAVVVAGVKKAARKQQGMSRQHQQPREFDRHCTAEYNLRRSAPRRG
jgi:hypothetical protein